MKGRDNVRREPVDLHSIPATPPAAWWLIFRQELAELWFGGRVLNLLILFSLLMSGTAYVLATNIEISLAPSRQMVLVAVQAAMTFGLFIGLVVAAESISGERERATLEPLLLTPAGRMQLVLAKFLAALSPWPVALALAMPYMATLSQGDPVLQPALLWGAVLGSLTAASFAAFGTLVSLWSNSTKISLFVSLLAYCLALLPSQLPGEVKGSPLVMIIEAIDPLEAANQFLQKTLQDGRPLSETWIFLCGALLFAVLIIGFLFWYAAPRLRLEAKTARPLAGSLLTWLGRKPVS